ncbi:MAG: hypothetical protein QG568_436 [Patescibacteria group bacterium]|nr:hypothetical protein [Patescibacteria group bacterium]
MRKHRAYSALLSNKLSLCERVDESRKTRRIPTSSR